MTAESCSVLIVDDDPWVTRALAQAFASAPGLRVLPPVHSGEAAVEAYREHRPDVVLMDVNMQPGITGVQATVEIRRFDPDARVVVLTTTAPGPGLARAVAAGAMAVIDKNAPPETVINTVRDALNSDDEPRLVTRLYTDIRLSGDAQEPPSPPQQELTAAEFETLRLICTGRNYEEIAARLNVAPSTVKTHTKHLREKLQAENLAGIILRAIEYRYISI